MGPVAVGSVTGPAPPGEEMNDPPRTYAEWVPLLERFRDGDDAVIDLMRAGTIEWTSVVAERWTSRLADAFNIRLKKVSAQLQLALDRAAGDTFAISRALLAARRALVPLHVAAALPCAPEEVRQHFAAELHDFAARTQESLESAAKRIRTDQGSVLKAIRDNPLNVPPPSTPTETHSEPQAPLPRGRRILM